MAQSDSEAGCLTVGDLPKRESPAEKSESLWEGKSRFLGVWEGGVRSHIVQVSKGEASRGGCFTGSCVVGRRCRFMQNYIRNAVQCSIRYTIRIANVGAIRGHWNFQNQIQTTCHRSKQRAVNHSKRNCVSPSFRCFIRCCRFQPVCRQSYRR